MEDLGHSSELPDRKMKLYRERKMGEGREGQYEKTKRGKKRTRER